MKKDKTTSKSSLRRIFAGAVGTVLLATSTLGALAQSIGINYVGSGSQDGGLNNIDADSLATNELAGAPGYAQTNWNNIGRWGTVATSNLVDSTGAATPLWINFDSISIFTSGAYGALGTSDGKLMDGFVSQDWAGGPAQSLTGISSVYGAAFNDKPLVFIGGLQAWMAQKGAIGYKIVMYVNGYHGWFGTSEHWVQAVTGSPLNNTMVAGADLTPHLFNADTGLFNGTYVQVSPTCISKAARSTGGNYEVFTGFTFAGMTNDEVLLRSSEPDGDYQTMTFYGYQIVPVFPTSPPDVSTPAVSPGATVYAGSPVQFTEIATGFGTLSYQWQTDGGTGGSLTNIPGATATNLMVVPPDTGSTYTINYDVAVANSFGATTSSVVALTVNAASAPIITADVAPAGNILAYAGGTVKFTAAFGGTLPIAYLWQSNSVNLLNATNTTLTLTNLPLSGPATYQLTATNSLGGNVSSAATLTVMADPPAPTASQPYAYKVITNNPVAYYRLDETKDNVNNTLQAYDYSGHGFDAIYGSGVILSNAGPQSPAYPGFETTNLAAAFSAGMPNGTVVVPPLNLNTNTVTFTAWIYPTAGSPASGGLFFNRNGNDAAGFGFGGNVDGNGQAELGYTWNTNSPSTYNYHSGLFPPIGLWSFVALTITPSNATFYLYYTDGVSVTNLAKVVRTAAHTPESFSGGTTWLGGDSFGANRTFNGAIDDVAIFASSLSEGQLQGLFLTGSGVAGVRPVITSEAVAQPPVTFVGQTIKVIASGDGAPVPGYQWQYRPSGSGAGSFADVVNGGRISGANSGTLTITNTLAADATDYRLVVTNSSGSATSAPVTVTLTPVPTNGLWTANFSVVSFNNGAPNTPYSGRGVLGTGTYWNGLTGGNFVNSASYRDDGSSVSGISLSCPSGCGCWFSGFPMNNALLDPYANVFNGSGGVLPSAWVFTNVPNGIYNLAVFGINGSGGNGTHGTTFTVNGVSQSLINVQDTFFVSGDNTALFTNVAVTNGGLVLGVDPNPDGGTEWNFNGAQLQAVSLNPVTLTTSISGTNLNLSWANYGTLLSATNLVGPWAPVPGAVSPFTVDTTTNTARFFRVKIQ